jgi:predicted NAD/FAD-binding protein
MPFADRRLRVAVVGTGISGMSAAWLLCQAHEVVVYEQATRPGGHSHTVDVPGAAGTQPVDMGFIVYNEATYPTLTALFRHLGVPTQASDMSFAVSLRDGALEYAGTDLRGLFAQRRNLLNPRFWSLLRDLVRFYRDASRDALSGLPAGQTLGQYLAANRYGEPFVRDHLLPMAAAIWSTPADRMADYPAAAFLRFCKNHGLLQLTDRPRWRTVTGGSRAYVERLTAPYADRIRLDCGVRTIRREHDGVRILDTGGEEASYDHVVIAAHADQALRMLADPSEPEARLLGALRYRANPTVMHRDTRLMPRRKAVWASWNYIGRRDAANDAPFVSYWMNRLQPLADPAPVFVTLNPQAAPAAASIIEAQTFDHPQFDSAALDAQRKLWSIQGVQRTWYCGAYFGAGFHEDGLRAGLAVAETLGAVRRPWSVTGQAAGTSEPGRFGLPGLDRSLGSVLA